MTKRLEIQGIGFTLDGRPFDMWGVRLANAVENDASAASAVRVLDAYVEHGVNTFSVFLMGGATGSANPYDADGSFSRRTRRAESSGMFKGRGDVPGLAERNAHLDRLAVLIEEANARGMVVNVGLFYQARIRQLADETALLRAAQSLGQWLSAKGYRNVFVDLVNEYGHEGFSGIPLCYGRSARYAPDGGEELLRAFKRAAPDVPASISPAGETPIPFPSQDLTLVHHLRSPKQVRWEINRRIPVVMNEWGYKVVGKTGHAWIGQYTIEDRRKWQEAIRCLRAEGAFVFYFSAWKQTLDEHGDAHPEPGLEGEQPRDSLGGAPSDHWWFDMVQAERLAAPAVAMGSAAVEMTPRERVLCALRGGTPDIVPFAEQLVAGNIGAQLLGLPETAVYRPSELARLMGNDIVKFSRNPPLFYQKITASTGASGFGPGLIRTRDDLDKLVMPQDETWIEKAREFLRNERGDRAAMGGTRLGISGTLVSMGIDPFSIMLYEDPDLVAEVLRRYNAFAKRTVQVFCELGFDIVWCFDDLACKTGPIFSPKVLRELVLPLVKPAADEIDVPWIFHSDGNIFPVMDDLLTLGMSGIHPIEPEAMDLGEAKRVLKGRACAIGNISVNTLAAGSPADVRRECEQCFAAGAPGGAYMISSGNGIPPYAKVENVREMVRAIAELQRRGPA